MSAALAKKKKYQNIKEIEAVLYSNINRNTRKKLNRKSSLTFESMEEYQALRLCRGDELRVSLIFVLCIFIVDFVIISLFVGSERESPIVLFVLSY